MTLNILDIIELRSQRVVDINDNDLPVGLLLVEQSHNTENLDLLHLTWESNQLTDFTDIQWIIVALGLGLGVDNVGVLPGLKWRSELKSMDLGGRTYLGESTIVPEIALVGEAVADETELALLDILLDWAGELSAQMRWSEVSAVMKEATPPTFLNAST